MRRKKNPYAKALRLLKPKVINSKKLYKRRKKHRSQNIEGDVLVL